MRQNFDIQRVKRGDAEALRQFFAFLYPRLMGLACRFVDDETAKDLVQDVFVEYWEQKHVMDVANVSSYLYKSVQNKSLNHIRHQSVVDGYAAKVKIAQTRIDYLTRNTDDNDLFRQISDQNLRELIEVSVKKLPPKCQEAFRLCYFHEMTCRETAEIMGMSDDYQYVIDLGLIKSIEGKIQPSNPIYGEVIARTLSHDAQEDFITEKPDSTLPRYLKDGKIDMDCLMQDFQQFWRENSDIWIEKSDYKEAAPHLILMAFLQRILNGSGQILREMAAGTGRTDLCLVYQGKNYPIELKIRRGEKSVSEGTAQTIRYIGYFWLQRRLACCLRPATDNRLGRKNLYPKRDSRRKNNNNNRVVVFGFQFSHKPPDQCLPDVVWM